MFKMSSRFQVFIFRKIPWESGIRLSHVRFPLYFPEKYNLPLSFKTDQGLRPQTSDKTVYRGSQKMFSFAGLLDLRIVLQSRWSLFIQTSTSMEQLWGKYKFLLPKYCGNSRWSLCISDDSTPSGAAFTKIGCSFNAAFGQRKWALWTLGNVVAEGDNFSFLCVDIDVGRSLVYRYPDYYLFFGIAKSI